MSFKYQNSSSTSEQTICNFQVDKPFSWQCPDLFLGLFSGFGRCLIWEIDNISVEFVQMCDYFMVNELFLIDLFRVSFPPIDPNYIASLSEKTSFVKYCLL